jgi:nitroimidazol reductase NimA-like FMN-containing flavoprotein (pyridoxamine 5'-phosphate oxidase superfamily)
MKVPQRNVPCPLSLLENCDVFIHEMSDAECRHVLQNAKVGRLACARNNQPYVVPIYFAFDGTYIYGFTTVGQKVEWMRSNELVCFEMDEIKTDHEWVSIVVFGRYEELPDTPECQCARAQAYRFIQSRAMWWEPAYISQKHRDQPHSLTPVFYRIHIEKMTGHRATLESKKAEYAAVPISNGKRGWLGRLLHRN